MSACHWRGPNISTPYGTRGDESIILSFLNDQRMHQKAPPQQKEASPESRAEPDLPKVRVYQPVNPEELRQADEHVRLKISRVERENDMLRKQLEDVYQGGVLSQVKAQRRKLEREQAIHEVNRLRKSYQDLHRKAYLQAAKSTAFKTLIDF